MLELKVLSGVAEFDRNHKPGMRVPKGGSSCASCEYLGDDRKTCGNEHFIKWNGSDKLPAPADEYCSDWYESDKKLTGGLAGAIARSRNG